MTLRLRVSALSVLALSSVSALVALPAPAGVAGVPPNGPEPNCEVPSPLARLSDPSAQVVELIPAVCTEVEVTKLVTGEPAPGTTFDVVVECEAPLLNGFGELEAPVEGLTTLPPGLVGPFAETLTFGEEGGTETLLVAGGECTVSEDPPAGCELVNINPDEFEILLQVLFVEVVQPVPGTVLPVTVTNDCPPEPETITEVVEVPVGVPAAPVVARARFTG